MRKHREEDVKRLKAEMVFKSPTDVIFKVIKHVYTISQAQQVCITTDKEMTSLKFFFEGVILEESTLQTSIFEEGGILEVMTSISRVKLYVKTSKNLFEVVYINGKWIFGELSNYSINGLLISVDHLFENMKERDGNLHDIVKTLIGFHLYHCLTSITLQTEMESLLTLLKSSSTKESFDRVFHVNTKTFSSIDKYSGCDIFGLYSPDCIIKESQDQILFLENDVAFWSEELFEVVNKALCRLYKVQMTKQIFPPFLLLVKTPEKYSENEPIWNQKDFIVWVKKVLEYSLFPEKVINCGSLVPDIVHYTIPNYNFKSSPPSPKKRRVFAISDVLLGKPHVIDGKKPNKKYDMKSKYSTLKKKSEEESVVSHLTFLPYSKDFVHNNELIRNFVIPKNVIQKGDLKQLYVVGQFDNKFIICFNTTSKVLYAFDQHAIHERILYENNSDAVDLNKETVFHSVQSKSVLYLSLSQTSVLEKYRKEFNEIGLVYDIDDTVVRFSALPSLFGRSLTLKELLDMLNQIASEKYFSRLLQLRVIKHIVASYSCRRAIMFNDSLTRTQCVELIDQLSTCQNPFICAHGRNSVYPVFAFN